MDIQLNDILVMKKAHPCGEKRWRVLRTGADFRLKCLGCGHEVMTPRFKAEKNMRQVPREEKYTTHLSPGGENPPGDFCVLLSLGQNRLGAGRNLR